MRVTQLFLSFVLFLIPLAIACGAYLMIVGLKSKTFISELDVAATKEEREQARATSNRPVSSASQSALPVASTERT
jgi:hypothetical protein